MRKDATSASRSFVDRLRHGLVGSIGSNKHGFASSERISDHWVGSCKECTERAFDIAEDLEAGDAREFTSEFQHPLRRSNKLWKFQVRRSDDRAHYRMHSESGDFLMYAKVCIQTRNVAFYTYDPDACEHVSLFDATRPAFTMSYNQSGSEWRLVEERCMHCHYAPATQRCACLGKREIAHIRQFQRTIGEGIFHCMEIAALPLRKDGCGPVPPPCLLGGQGQMFEPMRLTTRAPKWNDEVESLVMHFRDRHALSSAKNFQLTSVDRPDHLVCQYAKIGSHTFGIDIRHPLSVIQAFGISLSTLLWT